VTHDEEPGAGADLETIDLGQNPTDETGEQTEARTGRRRLRPPGKTWRTILAALAVVAIVGTVIALAASPRHSARPENQATPSAPTSSPAAQAPIPPVRVRVLFSRTSPNGTTITARIGLVRVAEAEVCSIVPVPAPPPPEPGCSSNNRTAPGVEFDYTARARAFRVTVLTREGPADTPLMPMNNIGTIREVLPGGVSVLADLPPVDLAVLHTVGLARVRVSSVRGGRDAMKPVNGWVAFASAPESIVTYPVEGLDAHGKVVATAPIFRCC
jgi:hypothetical protein